MDAVLLMVAFGAGLIVLVGFIATTRRARSGPHIPPPPPPQIGPGVQARIMDFLHSNPGKKIQVIKLLRELVPGLGLKEAKDAVEQMIDGTFQPALGAGMPVDTVGHRSLADRVRALKADGRTEQAVFLVRGETGMDQEDAEVFVGTLYAPH